VATASSREQRDQRAVSFAPAGLWRSQFEGRPLPFPISPSAMPRRRKGHREEERADKEEEEDGGVPAKLTHPTSVCINPADGDDGKGSSAAAAAAASSAAAAASPLYYIPSEIAPLLKAHQIAGIRFMFRAVAGAAAAPAAGGSSAASSRRRTSGAAILAHFCGLVRGGTRTRARAARPLPRGAEDDWRGSLTHRSRAAPVCDGVVFEFGPQGKTVQVISLVYVYLTARIGKHVLILAPVNTLQNWIAEFDKVSGRAAVCPPRCAVSVGPAGDAAAAD